MNLTIQPKPRETATSLLSRAAATYDVATTDFARDMGISYRSLVRGDRDAILSVALLTGLPEDAEQELISWSGVATGNVRTQFRGETFVSRALKNAVVRGCPQCLRENAAQSPGDPITEMAMWGHWQFRHVTVCVNHRMPLVELWSETNVFRRLDTQGRLTEIQHSLLKGHLDERPVELNGFDHWIESRLKGEQVTSWLAPLSLYAASTFCHHLGRILFRARHGEVADCVQSIREGDGLAFEVVKNGRKSIETCLAWLVETSDSEQLEPPKVFGPIFVLLNEIYISDPSFEVFRDILRECIIRNFALEGGAIVLGEEIPARKLHSVNTAAAEAGIGSHLMTMLLEDIGAVPWNRNFGPARTLFDAQKFNPFISEVATWVTQHKMKTVLGATKKEFAALVNEEIISPATKVTSYVAVWREHDAIKFLERLETLSRPSGHGTASMIGIYAAHTKTKIPIKKIIALVESGDFDLFKVHEKSGIRNYVIPGDQLEPLQPVKNADQARQDPSPAEFFRSIGMRTASDIKALIDHGYVTTTGNDRDTASAKKPLLSKEDIAEFHKKFCTLTTLVARTGLHRNSLRALIVKHSIQEFAIEGKGIRGLFLVDDVEPALQDR